MDNIPMEDYRSREFPSAREEAKQVTGKARRATGRIRVPWWMMLPSLLLIVGLYYYPSVNTLYYSLFNWNGFSAPSFIGLSNFASYFSSSTLGLEWRHQAILTVGMMVIALVVPLAAAELVQRLVHYRLAYVAKVLLVVPIAMPFIVNIGTWSFILSPNGPINQLLRIVGLGFLANGWLANSHVALYAILGIGFPWVAGLPFLLYLGGLQNISHELYDAFYLETRSFWQRLFRVDLPMIRGQLRLVIILTIIGSLQGFVTILILTNGGPGYATQVPGLTMYTDAFTNDQYGLGAAIGTVLFVVIVVSTLLYMWLDRRWGSGTE